MAFNSRELQSNESRIVYEERNKVILIWAWSQEVHFIISSSGNIIQKSLNASAVTGLKGSNYFVFGQFSI